MPCNPCLRCSRVFVLLAYLHPQWHGSTTLPFRLLCSTVINLKMFSRRSLAPPSPSSNRQAWSWTLTPRRPKQLWHFVDPKHLLIAKTFSLNVMVAWLCRTALPSWDALDPMNTWAPFSQQMACFDQKWPIDAIEPSKHIDRLRKVSFATDTLLLQLAWSFLRAWLFPSFCMELAIGVYFPLGHSTACTRASLAGRDPSSMTVFGRRTSTLISHFSALGGFLLWPFDWQRHGFFTRFMLFEKDLNCSLTISRLTKRNRDGFRPYGMDFNGFPLLMDISALRPFFKLLLSASLNGSPSMQMMDHGMYVDFSRRASCNFMCSVMPLICTIRWSRLCNEEEFSFRICLHNVAPRSMHVSNVNGVCTTLISLRNFRRTCGWHTRLFQMNGNLFSVARVWHARCASGQLRDFSNTYVCHVDMLEVALSSLPGDMRLSRRPAQRPFPRICGGLHGSRPCLPLPHLHPPLKPWSRRAKMPSTRWSKHGMPKPCRRPCVPMCMMMFLHLPIRLSVIGVLVTLWIWTPLSMRWVPMWPMMMRSYGLFSTGAEMHWFSLVSLIWRRALFSSSSWQCMSFWNKLL